jgi:hypothetical protein
MPDADFFASVLGDAIAQLRAEAVPVYTFAFYHDHESGAVSVCADTESNSARRVRATNRYNAKHFRAAVAEGDLAGASLWQANGGRNLSLGDFARVNLARAEFGGPEVGDDFHLLMVRALMALEGEVAALAADPGRLLFACSGPDDEVAYVWSLAPDAVYEPPEVKPG